MGKKIVSIEPGIWWTKVCLTDYQKVSPKVYKAFAFQTPEHAIEDGYIRDKDAFITTLMKEIQRHGIKERDVVFTLSSSKVVTREAVIPFVKDKKIDGIVASQVDEYFPMDVSDYVISYTKMGQLEQDGQKKIKLSLVAVPDNLLKNYYNFAEEAKLHIETFDYIGNGAVQIMKNSLSANAVVVQLEEQATVISILVNKKLVFQRVTPYGYATALASVLEHEIFGIKDESEAFDFLLKNEVLFKLPNLTREVDVPIPEGKTRQAVLWESCEDVKESLSYYLRMVNTAIEYYQNQQGGVIGGNVYLIGDGARLAGIHKLFEREFPMPIHNQDYTSYVNLKKFYQDDESVTEIGFLSVVGAAIHPLDIMSKEQKATESRKSNSNLVHILLACSILISVVLVLAATMRKLNAVSEQQDLQQQIANLSTVETVYQENETVNAAKSVYETIDDATKTENEQFLKLISELEDQFPKKVTVLSMDITDGTITLNLSSTKKLEAAQLLMNLKEISFIKDISIPSIAEEEGEGSKKSWQYTILATYKTEAEQEAEAAAAEAEKAETQDTEAVEAD
jgi:type IV pilus assembly protein PilM